MVVDESMITLVDDVSLLVVELEESKLSDMVVEDDDDDDDDDDDVTVMVGPPEQFSEVVANFYEIRKIYINFKFNYMDNAKLS